MYQEKRVKPPYVPQNSSRQSEDKQTLIFVFTTKPLFYVVNCT